MILLHFFFLQAKAFRTNEEDDDDNTDVFSEDEDLQSPIDDFDPFFFFVDTIKGTSYSIYKIWRKFFCYLKYIFIIF